MLELKNVSWTAPDGKEILKNISLTVGDGRLAVITGPNGGGKTTLARIIAGIEKPSNGQVILNGEDITGLDVTERAKKGVSYAFQQPVRFKGITVRQLMEIAAGEKLSEKQSCDILAKVGLCARSYINREINATLSGGEIKRIEIATVLARHTSLSVFDEPEAGIDLWSFENLIGVFRDIQKTLKGTLLIISHQERILRIADEVILISGGEVTGSGDAESVIKRMNYVQGMQSVCCREEKKSDE